jgi:hypothetical protein
LNDKFITRIYKVPGANSAWSDVDQCTLSSSDGLAVEFSLFPAKGALKDPKPEKRKVKIEKECVQQGLRNNRHIWPYLLEDASKNMGERPDCDGSPRFSCDIRDLYRSWLGLPMRIESFRALWYRGQMYQTLDNCDKSPVFIRCYDYRPAADKSLLGDGDRHEWILIVNQKKGDWWECQSSDSEGTFLLDMERIHLILERYPEADVIYGEGPAAIQVD